MGFVNDIRKTVTQHHAAIVAAEQARLDFQDKYSTVYSSEEFNRRMGEFTAARDEAISAGNSAVRALTSDFIESIATIDNLEGDKLTEDAKLLESAIPLTNEDLIGIFDRSQETAPCSNLLCAAQSQTGFILIAFSMTGSRLRTPPTA